MKMYENFYETLPAVQDVPDYAPKNFTRCEVAESKCFIDEKEGESLRLTTLKKAK